MKISIPENIGDRVTLDGGVQGRIIAIHLNGPGENISFEVAYWDEGSYRMTTFWRFEFEIANLHDEKRIEAGIT